MLLPGSSSDILRHNSSHMLGVDNISLRAYIFRIGTMRLAANTNIGPDMIGQITPD